MNDPTVTAVSVTRYIKTGPKKYDRKPTRTYACWKKMHERCARPTASDYSSYGGRGIKVCDRWRSYENFVADMGERPEDRFIERVDNDGNYEPSNCKWADRKEQGRNTRKTHFIEYAGKRLCVKDWCEYLSCSENSIYRYLKTKGEQGAIEYFERRMMEKMT